MQYKSDYMLSFQASSLSSCYLLIYWSLFRFLDAYIHVYFLLDEQANGIWIHILWDVSYWKFSGGETMKVIFVHVSSMALLC